MVNLGLKMWAYKKVIYWVLTVCLEKCIAGNKLKMMLMSPVPFPTLHKSLFLTAEHLHLKRG
jgi:hypothetical protein